MAEHIQESVRVATTLDHASLMPSRMVWRHREYQFLQCSMHYQRYEGDVLLHIFFMITNEACMQLILNTKTLLWTLVDTEPL